MKAQSNQQGSFGIPQDMQEAADRFSKKKKVESARTEEAREADTPPEPDETNKKAYLDEAIDELSPAKLLDKLGVKFDDEDLQQLIFKGYVEKEIVVIKGKFNITIKTLTGDEYDMVDELVVTEANEINVTKAGLHSRHASWVLAFGVTKLNGKPLCKPVKNKDGSLNVEETAELKRNVIGALSASVSNLIIEKHSQFNLAINEIIREPGKHSKN